VSDFEIRPLFPSDAPEAAALIRAAFADQGIATDPPSSALRETGETVAAKLAAGGGAGGFGREGLIGVLLWTPEPDALYLGRLAVAPAWRGRGLARTLIAAGEAEARSRGLALARAQARIALPRNRALFARLGYAEVGTRAHPGHAEPTIVMMEKALG
jgi:predicted N-acetyltransferase YhbS